MSMNVFQEVEVVHLPLASSWVEKGKACLPRDFFLGDQVHAPHTGGPRRGPSLGFGAAGGVLSLLREETG